MPSTAPANRPAGFVPPHPGSSAMPRWEAGELPPPPRFTWKNWAMLIGPGLVSGASAIGAGEWLTGPLVTARYGGALLWLATLSILGQVIYNQEISRYTLYCGEPIFTGKFRTLPGPLFWIFVYLALDFGSLFPYLASSAATPVAMIILQRLPQPATSDLDWWTVRLLGYAIFFLAVAPLAFGGKVYNSLKVLMTFKLTFVLGFLLFLAMFYSEPATWREIISGFFRFGEVPVLVGEDTNGNGVLDPGEDYDGDGRLDGVERRVDKDGDGDATEAGEFEDTDGDGHFDGFRTANVFGELAAGRGLPEIDLSMLAIVGAMAALAGTGGLTNTSVSGYTRDQGWGMGYHVGAIPSAFGGHSIKLSHVGMVFPVTPESRARFAGWYRHVMREQIVVWAPASILGLAMPSMLSVQFLPRGTEANPWLAAGMTADAVQTTVGGWLGSACWYLTLFCGLLVLALSVTTTADGYFRRWVDVMWTGLPMMRSWRSESVGRLYFGFLCGYLVLGMVMLSVVQPERILSWATNIYNYALGFSCWHALYINLTLLPRELRPNWLIRVALTMAGAFFVTFAAFTTLKLVGLI